MNAVMAHLQLFGLGLSFGLIGPCFAVCTPILVTYIAGSKRSFGEALLDTTVFLSARLLAYIVLGLLAGISGYVLKQFIDSNIAAIFKPIAGAISILLIIPIMLNKGVVSWSCKSKHARFYNYSSLFVLGFIIGIAPCGPLIALLLEIVLISKSIFNAVLYTVSFGLGTFLSGLIIAGGLSGLFAWAPARFLKSRTANLVFRIVCSIFLVLFGLSLIFGRYSIAASSW